MVTDEIDGARLAHPIERLLPEETLGTAVVLGRAAADELADHRP